MQKPLNPRHYEIDFFQPVQTGPSMTEKDMALVVKLFGFGHGVA